MFSKRSTVYLAAAILGRRQSNIAGHIFASAKNVEASTAEGLMKSNPTPSTSNAGSKSKKAGGGFSFFILPPLLVALGISGYYYQKADGDLEKAQ